MVLPDCTIIIIFGEGGMPCNPPSRSMTTYCYRGTYLFAIEFSLLIISPFYRKYLNNAVQMKLKLNKRIGATCNSNNCRKDVLWLKKEMLSLKCLNKSSLSCWEKQPLPPKRKPNGLYRFLFKKQIKSREHSSKPTLPGTATAF